MISGRFRSQRFRSKKCFSLQLVVAAFSGDVFTEFDIEVRIIDQNDNPIEIIDSNVSFSIREDENVGKLFYIIYVW